MYPRISIAALLCLSLSAARADAQAASPTPPPPPPPAWEVQVGASFVGTSGNSDTSSTGADFSLNRRWPVWQIESAASLIRTTADGAEPVERYLAGARAQRALTAIVKLSAGERAEHDPRAGMDLRNVLDAGLSWAIVRHAAWTLDGVTAIAWTHESPTLGPTRDAPGAVLQLLSRTALGPSSETTERITAYPDFRTPAAYRYEAEAALQAAINSRLALKAGYLLRYSHEPVAGFKTTDSTATVSIVLRWKAAA